MNISNEFIIPVQSLSHDATDNTLSLFKVIEELSASLSQKQYDIELTKSSEKEGLIIPVAFTLVTSWRFEKLLVKDSSFTFKISLLDPSGKVLKSSSQDSEVLPKGSKRMRINMAIQGVGYTTRGLYTYTVSVSDKDHEIVKASYGIDISIDIDKT